MKFEINKELLLEDYMQYMMDHWSNNDSINDVNFEKVKAAAQPIDNNIQDERIIDEFKPPKVGSNILKPVFPKFDDPEHTSLRMLRSFSKGHNLDYKTSVINAHNYMDELHHQENDWKVHGTNGNPKDSIEGAYQTSNAARNTDVNRFRTGYKMDAVTPYLTKENVPPVADMDLQQQTAMTIAGLSQHGNSKNHLQHFANMLRGDKQAGYEMYLTDHHTKPDVATINRWDGIYGKYNIDRTMKILDKRFSNEPNYLKELHKYK